jgi:hypothetical protein
MGGIYNRIPRTKKFGGMTFYLHSHHRYKHRMQLEYASLGCDKYYGRSIPYKKGWLLYIKKK